MKRYKKIFLWVLAAFVLFSILGFFVAPPVLKYVLVKKMSERLSRPVSIGKIALNPYTMTLTVRDVLIREKTGQKTFFSVDQLRGSISPMTIRGIITLNNVSFTRPHLNLVRNNDGSYNISDLLELKREAPRKPGTKGSGAVFSFRDIAIKNGSVDIWDGPQEKKHTVRELNVSVPLLSNYRKNIERNVQPTISFKFNDDPYVIRGRTKPFADSLETEFDIDIGNIDIPYYLAYLPLTMRFSVPSGYLDIKMQLSFRQFRNRDPSLSLKGDLTVSKVVVNDLKGRKVIDLPVVKVTSRSIEPLGGNIELSRVAVESPDITVSREKNGAMSLLTLVPEVKKEKDAKAPAKKVAKAPAKKGDETKASTEKQPFRYIVDTIELTGGTVRFTDQSLKAPAKVTLEKIDVKCAGITSAKDAAGTFSANLVINRRGSVSLEGTLGIEPLTVKAKVDAKGVDVRPFEPYFTDRVRISVASGAADAKGDLAVTELPKKGLSGGFKGTASVTGLSVLDKETAANLLRFKSFHIRSLDASFNPSKIAARGVSLTDFYANIAVRPDRTVNLQNIMVKDTSGEAAPQAAQASGAGGKATKEDKTTPVTIDAITLQGGTVRFQDESVKPAFTTRLDHIGGRISGLSSREDTRADMELRATLENSAPLEITGKINPLSKDLYVDIKASFRDMDLTPVSPYSGKYAGYAIDKGKLSFDVQYLIENRKLDSKNSVFIDQLTFGQRVESPDATKLPVRLAVALLKDRRGQIKLDLPVTGSIDDPKFSVWRIVIQIILNLLAKAATAPFALLGAAFGGGEELGYIEFDYGRIVINDAAAKKLDTLAKVLAEKDSLKLDITGHVDLERDREGFKQYLVQKKVRAQKLKDLMKKSSESIDVDDVKIEKDEYEKYLRLAYKAEKFAKPRNMIGFEKSLPVPEMEKLMLTNTKVAEEDLRNLARLRATKVMERLIKVGKVEAGRLFIVDGKSLAPEKNAKLKDSRVDFKLK